MNLSRLQQEAVEHIHGPLLVFAGAGSGKTRVITNRISHMIHSKIPANQIVALSFTNKSAKEMNERLRKMVPKEKLRGIILSTFHSLGLKILKEHIHRLGYKNPFVIFSSSDQESLVAGILKNHKLDPRKIDPRQVIQRISRVKNGDRDYWEQISSSGDEIDSAAALIFEKYVEALKMQNSVDFDDLILLPKLLLENFEEVRQYYFKKYSYYLIDEFQDTNLTQYSFIKLLMGTRNNICVVGDDDQSIYAFRGSVLDLILNFEKDFKGTKVIRLLENYRSTAPIIQAANALIQNNTNRSPKAMVAKKQTGDLLEYYLAQDEKGEAEFVVDTIQNHLIRNEFRPNQIAILYRTNYQSRAFEEELRKKNIPYEVIGGYNFFDRKEVKDVISYLRYIGNRKDEGAFLRIVNYPKRGIGSNTIELLLKASMEESIGLSDVMAKILESPDYLVEIKSKTRSELLNFQELIETYRKKFFSKDKLSFTLKEFLKESKIESAIELEDEDEKVTKAKLYNLSELVNMVSYYEDDPDLEGEPNLYDFLHKVSLFLETGDDDKDRGKVEVLTIHQSKGLEYELVFVVGLEDGTLPSTRSFENVEEERRLMYVALTRAKQKIYLTSCQKRKKFGEYLEMMPSRFLDEIPQEFLKIKNSEEVKQVSEEELLHELQRFKLELSEKSLS